MVLGPLPGEVVTGVVGTVLGVPGLPQEVEHWSLTALREKLVKIGAKVVRHGRVAPDTAAAQIIEKCIAGMKIAQLSRAAKGDK